MASTGADALRPPAVLIQSAISSLPKSPARGLHHRARRIHCFYAICCTVVTIGYVESKQKGKNVNKILHAVVLVFFGIACWFLSMMLKMPTMVGRSSGVVMPAFTRLCVAYGPLLAAGLAISALAYCLYVWTRKAADRATSIAFLAPPLSALV